MNNSQENKLSMCEAVAAVLERHEAAIAAIPSLATAKADALSLLETIKVTGRSRKESTAGKTASKTQTREALVLSTVRVASALYSYGIRTKNTEAAAIADLKLGSLRRMRDTELVSHSTSLHAWALAQVGSLQSYGITQPLLDELNEKIGAFSSALGEREASFAERIGATAALVELFRQMDALLGDEVDRLVQLTRGASDEFYREYFAARVVKDLGGRRGKAAKSSATTSTVPPPPAGVQPSVQPGV